MPPGNPAPGSVEDWMARARRNLALPQVPLPSGAYYEDLCFHAQQAAEKALKAVFVHRNWEFPYVHDLVELNRLLESNGLAIPDVVRRAGSLTLYAHETRYPGVADRATSAAHRDAVSLSSAVVKWAESIIATP